MPLKTALIGYGFAGKTFHAPLIKATIGLDLITVVSSRAQDVHADLPNVKVTDFEGALNDSSIDLMVIATPNALHGPQAMAALTAGKHVVIDKPFALDTDEAQALIDQARRVDRRLSVFHNRRWDGDFLTLKHLLDTGQLGEVSLMLSRFDRFRPHLRNRWREQAEKGAGLWFDLGSHLVDQALCLFGWPQGIEADMAQQRDGSVVDDYFHATLHFGSRRVRLQASALTPAPGPRFEVHGRKGSYVKYGLDTQEDSLKAGQPVGGHGWSQDQDGILTRVSDSEALAPESYATLPGRYQAFYEGTATAILSGGPLPVPAEAALKVMQILDAGRLSANEGRTIGL